MKLVPGLESAIEILIKDLLAQEIETSGKLDAHHEQLFEEAVFAFVQFLTSQLHREAFFLPQPNTRQVSVPLLNAIPKPRPFLGEITEFFWTRELTGGANLFATFRSTFHANRKTVSKRHLSMKDFEAGEYLNPDQHPDVNHWTVLNDYFNDTPFKNFFETYITIHIPEEQCFSGTYVLAPPGRGKTTLLKRFIATHLDEVANGNASLVVMNSDRDLIDDIAKLRKFAPGQPLAGKLVLIEPDMQHPPALNLFAMGKQRLDAYDHNQREAITNKAIELFAYVFDCLGDGGELTQKQLACFRPTIRALMQLPDANITTLMDVLRADKLSIDVSAMNPESRAFMQTMLYTSTFRGTRDELGWRLHNMLDSRPFALMFNAPTCLDLFTELNRGKVILIYTNKNLLAERQTEIFGRFFIAMLQRAAIERDTIRDRRARMPTYLIVDECQDYVRNDTKIADMLKQCRKMNVSITLSNQKLSDLAQPVQEALLDVPCKFVNVNREGKSVAPFLGGVVQPDHLNLPRGMFAVHIEEVVYQTFGWKPDIKEIPTERMSDPAYEAMMGSIRSRYTYDPDSTGFTVAPPLDHTRDPDTVPRKPGKKL